MKTWIAIVVFALGLDVFAATEAVAPRLIEVQGHRGTRGTRPENTLIAFQEALEAGVDVLEMDLAVTRDDILVISHDPRINPAICKGPGARKKPLIRELTLLQVKLFDCGTLKEPRFPDQRPSPGATIPTLEEVFAFVRESKLPQARRVGFNIEAKVFADDPSATVSPEVFAKLAIESFRKSGFMDRITLQSFDTRVLAEAARLAPELGRSLLIKEKSVDILAEAKRIPVRIVSPDARLLTADRIRSWHANGLRVIPWTVNEPDDWERVIAAGVDGIITDFPAKLIEYLNRRRK